MFWLYVTSLADSASFLDDDLYLIDLNDPYRKPPTRAALLDFRDGKFWMLAQNMIYEVGTRGEKIVVPAGFVTDLTSVPPRVRSYVSVAGKHKRAAIIHDYLYWTQECEDRETADKVMRAAMQDLQVRPDRIWAVYAALRAAGGNAWRENQNDRKKGYVKVVPLSNWTYDGDWLRLREHLRGKGTRQFSLPADRRHCGLSYD